MMSDHRPCDQRRAWKPLASGETMKCMAFALLLLWAFPVWAGDACTWNTNTNGNWTDTTKWNTCSTGGAHYPGQTDATDTAVVSGASAGTVVTLNTTVTVNSLTLGGTYAGTLQFDGVAGRTLTLGGTTATTLDIKSNGTLNLNGNGTLTLSANSGGINNAGTITTGTSGAINLKGNFVNTSSGTFTNGTSSTLQFNGTVSQTWSDSNTTKQDVGAVTIASTVTASTSVKSTSVTINASKSLDISNNTLTLSGTGTPLTITGTLTENVSSTVEFAATSGTTTVNARTYGGNLMISGNGGTFNAGGAITVTHDLTVSTGASLSMGSNNLTMSGAAGTVYTSSGSAQTFDTDKLSTDFTQCNNNNCTAITYFSYLGTPNFRVHTAGGSNSNAVAYVTSGASQSAGKVRASVVAMDTAPLGNRAGVIGLYNASTGTGVVGYFKGGGTPIVAIATVDTSTGSITEQTTANYTMTSGDTIRLDISGATTGATVTLYVNDVQKTQWTNADLSSYTGTFWGIFHANGGGGQANKVADWDNVEVASTIGFGKLGSIVGAGSISQSASATTTLKGNGNLGGTSAATPGTCSGTNGSFQFYNLTLGDNVLANTTTGCGNFTVSNVLTIAGGTANQTFSAGSSTVTLSGTGTPFVNNGTFTASTSTVNYTATAASVTVTSATYNNLGVGTTSDTAAASTFTLGGNTTANGTVTIGNASSTNADILNTSAASNYSLTAAAINITSKGTLTANASTVTLSGTGTPFTVSGTFNVGTSIFYYTGTSANVTATTYYHLYFNNASGSYTLGTGASQTITTNGKLRVWAGGVDASANNPNIQINGIDASNGSFGIDSGATWTKGTGTITLGGSAVLIADQGGQDVNPIVVNTTGVSLYRSLTATSVTINAGQSLDVSNNTLTLTGSGTPLSIGAGATFTVTSSTVNYIGSSATTVTGTTYNNLGVGTTSDTGAGVTYTLGGDTTVQDTLTVGNAGSTNTDTLAASSYTLTLSKSGASITPFALTSKGSFTANTSTVNYTGTNSTVTLATATYNNLGVGTTSDTAAASTFTLGGNTTANGTVTIGNASSTNADILNTSAASNYSLTAAAINITSKGTLTANASTVTLSGTGTPFTVSGTFNANTSTVSYTSGSGVTALSSVAMTGSNGYYNLTINGTGTFTAGVAVDVANVLTVTAGTLAMGANNLTVGTGTSNGHVVGAGGLSQSASATTTIKGSGNLGGTSSTTPGTCSGTSGTYTFYNLTVGDGTNAKTTYACGNFTVSNIFTVRGTAGGDAANQTFDAGSKTIHLQGTGTPFALNGVLTPSSSIFNYEGAGAKVTPTTYNHLTILTSSGQTVTLGTAASQTITTNGKLWVLGGNVNAATYSPTLNINGVYNSGTDDRALAIQNGSVWQKGGTVTFGGSIHQSWDDLNTGANPIQDVGTVTVNNSSASGVTLDASAKATSMTINSAKKLDISGQTLTLTGTGTPLTITGTLTETAASTVEFAATSGTTTVNARTYGGNLKINGSGGTFNAGGATTVTSTLTTAAGTFEIGTNTVTGANVTVSGGTLSMTGSGGQLKISGNGTLSMTSGTLTTTDLATPPFITSDAGTNYVGVSLTGGTLNVASLRVDQLKNTGFVIGSGMTITNFNKVNWGDSTGAYHTQSTSPRIILDITSQTVNLLNHVFPTTWATYASGDCNVRSNTSGVVTMWDWSGTYGGASYSCNNAGGEVVWKGGGSASPSSGTGQYPAIY